MSRIVRKPKIGVRVTKVVNAVGVEQAPTLIDNAAHASFVKNLFSIRAKTRGSGAVNKTVALTR